MIPKNINWLTFFVTDVRIGNVKIKSGLKIGVRNPTERFESRNPKNRGCVQRKTHISDIKRLVGIDLIPESVLDISNRNRFHP